MIPAKPESYQPLKSPKRTFFVLHVGAIPLPFAYWSSAAPYAKPQKWPILGVRSTPLFAALLKGAPQAHFGSEIAVLGGGAKTLVFHFFRC